MSHPAFPIASDVIAYLTAIGSTNAIGSTTLSNWLASTTTTLQRETRRQFEAAVATRNFDGSGTGELVIDDYVAISAVKIYGLIGAANPLTFNTWVEEEVFASPKSKILINRGSAPAYGAVYINQWPEGRRNIEITANWGYGASVPDDIWQGLIEIVSDRAIDVSAAIAAANAGGAGPLKDWTEADIKEGYDTGTRFSDLLGSNNKFQKLVKLYAKKGSQKLKSHRVMI